ncbi:nucleoside deaminase [Granulicella sp. S190]|uniref:nucleoside deaminase n=1 Tax=Granulicella sp. S190 TaxID=1747226 RepID=UPI00131CE0BE|nr:nucleoside deaminase [Granulicella sp. S190]
MAPKNPSSAQQKESAHQLEIDRLFMERLIRFTAKSLETATPVPFGALIVHSETGSILMRGRNAVGSESDPSAHAELRTVRKATKKLKSINLSGYTMYSTCEPCPMCMANALWAGIDRVVYGATIADANRHCRQIRISAKEVVRRSDMTCSVKGAFLRARCYALFTHPNMLKAFATWSSRSTSSSANKTRRTRKRSSRNS